MSDKATLPFVLSCYLCDDGDGIWSEREAGRLGWQDIESDPGGLSYNFIGICPECAPLWLGTGETEGETPC